MDSMTSRPGPAVSHQRKPSAAGRSRSAAFTAALMGCAFAVASAGFAQAPASKPAASSDANPPVTVTDNGTSWVLDNGYLTATINKKTGDMSSLKVHGLETQGFVSGHHAGYWEQTPNGAARMESKLTIDPATNGGARAEVSIKGWSDGKNLNSGNRVATPAAANPAAGGNATVAGRPAGAAPAGGAARTPALLLDLELRYTLERGGHGIYTYAIFTHPPTYGPTQIVESRYGMKLSGDLFDWLSVDAQRNGKMAAGTDWDKGTAVNMNEARRLTTGLKAGKVEHKYDYSAGMFDTPAYGWSSTKQHVGLYIINPTVEYLSDGPDHFELTGHLDEGSGGDPSLLIYWRASHYGGSQMSIAANEDWNKVVGPIMIYVNSGPTPDAMFADAKRQAKVEAAKWPYAWVSGADYPLAAQRATVSGQLLLRDPQAPGATLPNLLVGLAYPDDPPAPTQPPTEAQPATWQSDAKHYQFWARGTPDGRFAIPNVRAGTYQLHAIADGVLGEYAKASVTVAAGGKIDLGKLVWTPVRYGKQLWQIGIPNRSASEFLRGNDHWHWGEYIQYAKLFPSDVNYTVGKSDFHKDWFIYQVPHDENTNDMTGTGQGRETPWTVNFNLAKAPLAGGRGVLRLALCGVGAPTIGVQVNGQEAGTVTGLVNNATINRDGVEGSWVEKDISFDASLLHAGTNTLTLKVPAGPLTSGIAYDVVRLELAPARQDAK
jgi:rhamnogalacturonan endolyase